VLAGPLLSAWVKQLALMPCWQRRCGRPAHVGPSCGGLMLSPCRIRGGLHACQCWGATVKRSSASALFAVVILLGQSSSCCCLHSVGRRLGLMHAEATCAASQNGHRDGRGGGVALAMSVVYISSCLFPRSLAWLDCSAVYMCTRWWHVSVW
jgi:hypothetical protein